MPLIPIPAGKSRQISEFKVSLVYLSSSWSAKATQSDTVLETQKKEKKNIFNFLKYSWNFYLTICGLLSSMEQRFEVNEKFIWAPCTVKACTWPASEFHWAFFRCEPGDCRSHLGRKGRPKSSWVAVATVALTTHCHVSGWPSGPGLCPGNGISIATFTSNRNDKCCGHRRCPTA